MYFFTKHALEKMDSLGLSKEEVKTVIAKGMKWKEQNNEKWHAQMGGIETVFGKEEDNFVVITVHLGVRGR